MTSFFFRRMNPSLNQAPAVVLRHIEDFVSEGVGDPSCEEHSTFPT